MPGAVEDCFVYTNCKANRKLFYDKLCLCVALVLRDSFDEVEEERMWIQHGAGIFRMELCTDVPFEFRNFDDFDERAVWI